MKKLIFALALLMMGGASLSTANAASIAPVAITISEAAQVDSGLELVGGYKHRRHHYYGHKFYKGHYYGGGYKWYPHGYYKGFCYDKPYHWWCKKYFYGKKYY